MEKTVIAAALLTIVIGTGASLDLKAVMDFIVAGVVAVISAPLVSHWI
jgi:hypothetical protein